MKTVSLKPTPEGLDHMRRVFAQTKNAAETKLAMIEQAAALLDDAEASQHRAQSWIMEFRDLVQDAFDALEQQEMQRIKAMEDGIAEIDGSRQ